MLKRLTKRAVQPPQNLWKRPKNAGEKKKAEEGGVNEEEKVEPVKKKRIRKRTLLS